jgi:tetratricopeptide (TPR) repeat protein
VRVKPEDERYYEATFLLGLCRYHMAEYDKAQAAFARVLQAFPLNEVWNNLGAAQSRRNLPEALESFENALEGDPNDPDYNFNVGYALWRAGEFDEAAESFRAALDRNSDDSVAKTLLARCLKKSGPRQTETRVEALERIKDNFNGSAYRQLQAVIADQNQ